MTDTQAYFRQMSRKGLSPDDLLQWDPDWLYQMKRVYVVCFLDFELIKGYPEKYRWNVVRMDRNAGGAEQPDLPEAQTYRIHVPSESGRDVGLPDECHE